MFLEHYPDGERQVAATVEVKITELQSLAQAALIRLGYADWESALMSKILMYAETRGSSQGLIKLTSGGMARDPRAQAPSFEPHPAFPAVGSVQGHWNQSMVTMDFAADNAVMLAERSGIGIVGVSEMNTSSGALGFYAEKMANRGFVGVLFGNTLAKVAPFGAGTPLFGTNPLAVALPRAESAPIVLDMATSSIAWFDLMLRAQAGQSLPAGVAFDAEGNPTQDAHAALKGALSAFGGPKGSGLSLVIELLGGAFVGAHSNQTGNISKNWGSLVVAIRSDLFGPSERFIAAVDRMASDVEALRPVREGSPVSIPGGLSSALAQRRGEALQISEKILSELKNMAGDHG